MIQPACACACMGAARAAAGQCRQVLQRADHIAVSVSDGHIRANNFGSFANGFTTLLGR